LLPDEVFDFSIGERVQCRDKGKKWKFGKVTSLAPLEIQPDGWNTGHQWDEVQQMIQDASSISPSGVTDRPLSPVRNEDADERLRAENARLQQDLRAMMERLESASSETSRLRELESLHREARRPTSQPSQQAVEVGMRVEVKCQGSWYTGYVVSLPKQDHAGMGRYGVQCDTDLAGLVTYSNELRIPAMLPCAAPAPLTAFLPGPSCVTYAPPQSFVAAEPTYSQYPAAYSTRSWLPQTSYIASPASAQRPVERMQSAPMALTTSLPEIIGTPSTTSMAAPVRQMPALAVVSPPTPVMMAAVAPPAVAAPQELLASKAEPLDVNLSALEEKFRGDMVQHSPSESTGAAVNERIMPQLSRDPPLPADHPSRLGSPSRITRADVSFSGNVNEETPNSMIETESAFSAAWQQVRTQERLMVGSNVRVSTAFDTSDQDAVRVAEGVFGVVTKLDEDGDALVDFDGIGTRRWVNHRNFDKLNLLQATDFKRVMLRPGPIGLHIDCKSGTVMDVDDGQCKSSGIQRGMRLIRIDGDTYDERLLQEKIVGSRGYIAVFVKVLLPMQLQFLQVGDVHWF
jgi:hypothetical protein